jgi:hypothetical protein
MADKSTNFVIKVNSKEVDLAKTSFKDFKKIIADAKKELQSLPVSDPRYKQLATDINAAEKAWKEATKAAADFGDENEKGEEQVKSYRLQVREATIALQSAEQQFGKNSTEANKLRETLKDLKDQQDDFNETTRKLDDSLAGIPGPIGKIGQGMQQLGEVTNNAKSALSTLGNQFNTTDKIVKATLIGFIVGLLVALVAAVMNAAKSFKPLQDAFAAFDDAIGAVFDALKPLTDFILNIVVGAIKLLADAITFVAEAFGGVSNGAAKATLDLEREIKKQEQSVGRLSDSIGENTSKIIQSFAEYNKALLEVSQALKDKVISDQQALDQRYLIELNHIAKLKQLRNEFETQQRKVGIDQEKQKAEIQNLGIKNQRKVQELELIDNNYYNQLLLANNIESYKARKEALQYNLTEISKINLEGKKEVIDALKSSISEQNILIANGEKELKSIESKGDVERKNLKSEFAREDRKLINERAIAIQQLSTQLIKEENARNLQAAKDSLLVLKEQNRVELEEAALAGVSQKNLKEKQAAELLVAQENIRKAQLQADAFLIEQQIQAQQRLTIELEKETTDYFQARKNLIDLEFQKEFLLADKNYTEQENARTKHYQALKQLNEEKIQAQLNLLQIEFNGLSENTTAFFEKQRDIEKKNFELQETQYKLNYEKTEALRKQHQKNMNLIDASELQTKSDLQMRAFMVLGTMRDEFFGLAVASENSFYEAEKKRAGDNANALTVIELEHFKRVAQIDADRIEAKNSVYAAIAQIAQEFASILSGIAQQELESAQGTDKAKFESAKKFAKTALIIERAAAIAQIVANTGIANAKAVATSPITFGQPWVTINTIAAGVSIAGIIASAVKGINDLNAQQFQPAGEGGSGGNSNRMGRGYAKGGVIDGQRHSQGGVLIEAEGGEAVMTRDAVSMFGPMLNMMNQMGGGANFAPNLTTTLMDKPIVSNPSEQQAPIIMKTYVVEKDLTDVQQRQARLKELSTL